MRRLIGDITTDTVDLPSKGTPQGAVLSPLLFNLAILNIPRRLEQIPSLKFSLYTDITLWLNGGSDSLIEDTLQEGVQIVVKEAANVGLTCSPSKSELLLLPPKRRSKVPPDIKFRIENNPIPEVSTLKILGMLIQNNRTNTQLLRKLERHVIQTIGLIRRISNRRRGI